MKDLKTENKDHAIVVNEAWFSIAEELAEGVNECLEGNTESPEIIAKIYRTQYESVFLNDKCV